MNELQKRFAFKEYASGKKCFPFRFLLRIGFLSCFAFAGEEYHMFDVEKERSKYVRKVVIF